MRMTLRQVIRAAKRSYKKWPKWMRKTAYNGQAMTNAPTQPEYARPDALPADARRDDLVREINKWLLPEFVNDPIRSPGRILSRARDALARSTGACARIAELEQLLTRMDNEHAEHHYFTCPAENDMPCDCPIGPLHDAARSALKVRK